MGTKPCVFFDRDGILNESPGPGYVRCWEEFRLHDDIVPVLRLVAARGYAAVIVTNQRGVALGLVDAGELQRIHRNLRDELRARGADVLDILVCPHAAGTCHCRKPEPGLLLEAAARHGLDLTHSWMVGDQETDIEAGRRARCRTIRVCGPEEHTTADYRASDLKGLAVLLESVLESPPSEGLVPPRSKFPS